MLAAFYKIKAWFDAPRLELCASMAFYDLGKATGFMANKAHKATALHRLYHR